MTGAKICGLTTPEAVNAALDGGADYLGFVFFDKSPRNVSLDAAAALAGPARGRAQVTAVVVDPSDAELAGIMGALRPELIQLHGRESPERVAEVRALTGAKVTKVIPIAAVEDLTVASVYATLADYLMFESKPPAGAALPGGLGAPFDWTLLSGVRAERPWFLAGGLDSENVAEAVRVTGAPLVDVSSGVERAPGVKDPALITAFLAKVRASSPSPLSGERVG